MNRLFILGRVMYAVAVGALGLEHLIRGNFSAGLLPFPTTFPGRYIVALVVGVVFLFAGLCIATLWKGRLVASWLGVFFLLLALYLHAPILAANIHNGGEWTVLFELVAFSAGAFYLAGALPQPLGTQFNLEAVGRWLFAGSLLIFAIQHYIYGNYVATLIPSWIPARLFWAYFVGVAFAGTAVSLVLNWKRKLATVLLGMMFLLWVLILHAPRVATHLQTEPEWTSLFVALAMSGIAFSIAGSQAQKRVETISFPTRSEVL